MAKLVLANLIFFLVIAGGLMFASGNYQLLNLVGFNFLPADKGHGGGF